jgi:hypothetical protein
MADHLNVTPGIGASIATDEISGYHYQRVKLIEGADSTNDGDISSANPLPVQARVAVIDANWFQATITSADATSATAVKAKTAGKKIHIVSAVISVDTAMSVQFQNDAGTPVVIMEQIYLAANGGMAMVWPKEFPLQVAENTDLDVITSASGNLSVTISGYIS